MFAQFIAGKDNTLADGLSRRPDHYVNADGSTRFPEDETDNEVEGDVVEVSSSEYLKYLGAMLGERPDKLHIEQSYQERHVKCASRHGCCNEEIAEVYDRIATLFSDVLTSMMKIDDTVVKAIKTAYQTDEVSIAIFKAPEEYDSFGIINGLIFKLRRDGGKSLYIPATAVIKGDDNKKHRMRELLCHETHDSPVAGHLGRDRTSALLKRSFYWPKMDDQVAKHVRECDECQQNKAKHTRVQGDQTPR